MFSSSAAKTYIHRRLDPNPSVERVNPNTRQDEEHLTRLSSSSSVFASNPSLQIFLFVVLSENLESMMGFLHGCCRYCYEGETWQVKQRKATKGMEVRIERKNKRSKILIGTLGPNRWRLQSKKEKGSQGSVSLALPSFEVRANKFFSHRKVWDKARVEDVRKRERVERQLSWDRKTFMQ